MEILKYDGNLKEDIENSNKRFNKKKEIIKSIILTIASLIIVIPITLWYYICFFKFDQEDIKEIIIFLSGSLVVQIPIQYNIFKQNKKRFIEQIKKSKAKLNRLAFNLSLLKEEIDVEVTNLEQSVIIEESEKLIEKVNNVKKSTKTITNTFYFLDTNENIQALKSIREILTEGRKITSDEINLYYAKEELDGLVLPVKKVKKLKLK